LSEHGGDVGRERRQDERQKSSAATTNQTTTVKTASVVATAAYTPIGKPICSRTSTSAGESCWSRQGADAQTELSVR
jgi:hypothetical protein